MVSYVLVVQPERRAFGNTKTEQSVDLLVFLNHLGPVRVIRRVGIRVAPVEERDERNRPAECLQRGENVVLPPLVAEILAAEGREQRLVVDRQVVGIVAEELNGLDDISGGEPQ